MELFNEVKNKYFQLLFHILNSSNKGIRKEELKEIIDSGDYIEKPLGKDFKIIDGYVLNEYEHSENFNLLRKKDNKYYPSIENKSNLPIKVRFTSLEKMWFRYLIENDDVKKLLGDNIVNKLLIELKDVNTIDYSCIIEKTNISSREKDYLNDEIREKFYLILQAIKDNRPVYYSNKDKYGNTYENKISIPLRVDYSILDDKIRVSMYSLDYERPIMVNIDTIYDVKIDYDSVSTLSRNDLLDKLRNLKYVKEPIVLELRDEKAAMERCFMSFSCYARTSKALGDNNYEIHLYYYTFEEDDIVRKILSLGPYVKVTSPSHVVDKILNRLLKTRS